MEERPVPEWQLGLGRPKEFSFKVVGNSEGQDGTSRPGGSGRRDAFNAKPLRGATLIDNVAPFCFGRGMGSLHRRVPLEFVSGYLVI